MPSAIPPNPMEQTAVVRPPASGGRWVFGAIAIASLVVLAGVGGFMLMPKVGKVEIDVGDKNGKKIDRVSIYLDGARKCDTRPCIIEASAGKHLLKTEAESFASDEQTVEIKAGDTKPISIVLQGTVSDTKKATGLHVAGTQPGLKLFIDDKEVGPLPQDVKDIAAGTHTVKISGSDRLASLEKSVTLEEGKLLELGNVTLKVLKCKVSINIETLGASVLLISGTDRRVIPFPGLSLDLDTTKSWTVEATKPTMGDFRQTLSFEDGKTEKTVAIRLEPKGKEKEKDPANTAATPDKPEKPEKAAEAPAAGPATITMNSIPPSMCFLDGASMGQTPKSATVSPGKHTVKYVNSELGESRVVVVNAVAGKRVSAGIKF